MSAEKIYLENEFKSYLLDIDLLKHETIRSYIATLKNNIFLINKLDYENVKKIIDNEDFTSLYKINFPVYKNSFKIKKSTYENFLTHCKRYINFLIYIIEQNLSYKDNDNQENNFEVKENEKIDFVVEFEEFEIEIKENYNYDFIFNNFEFRLITQNRFNKCGLFFPVSFFKQYFYKTQDKKYFDSKIKTKINNIKLFDNKKEYFKLSKIKKIVKDKQNNLFCYTSNIDKFQLMSYCTRNKNYIKFNIEKFSDITIDHSISMNTILKKLKENKAFQFEQTQMISNELQKSLRRPLNYKKLIAKGTKLSNNTDFINKIDKKKLKNEFEIILDEMDLQLMHKKHNNFKRAKD